MDETKDNPQGATGNATKETDVVVIGGGFSGIGAGIKLKEAGFSLIIPEKAADLGGTWRDNTYPGIELRAYAHHALRCLTEARAKCARFIEVSPDANAAYSADVLERQKNTLFHNQDCSRSNSYYFDMHGDAPVYRPSSGFEMWLCACTFPLADYRFS